MPVLKEMPKCPFCGMHPWVRTDVEGYLECPVCHAMAGTGFYAGLLPAKPLDEIEVEVEFDLIDDAVAYVDAL